MIPVDEYRVEFSTTINLAVRLPAPSEEEAEAEAWEYAQRFLAALTLVTEGPVRVFPEASLVDEQGAESVVRVAVAR